MQIDIKIIGNHIWFEGEPVAIMNMPEGTKRDRFLELIDPDLLRERIEEEKEAAYDSGYDSGFDSGHEEGYNEGLEEGKAHD